MEFSLQDVASMLGGMVEGDGTVKVSALSKIEEGSKGSIAFLSNPKYESYLYETKASAVIVNKNFVPQKDFSTNLIKVDDPYTSFTLLLKEYQKFMTFSKVGIESPSYIGEAATHGEGLFLGAFAYVGKGCKIGNNVKIHPQVHIGDNSTIGDNTVIYSGAKLYAGTQVGNNCTIHSGAVVGSDGFGFAPQADGSYEDIPQIGTVIIEDSVSIGANTVIDCATMGHTIIKKGAKLDNLIQIAHNVEVGQHTVIAAQAGISGSTKIGDNCMIGGQVGLGGHINIGDKTNIGAQAGIIKNIKGNQNLLGSPAMEVKNYFKSYAIFKNLPDLIKRIAELEEKVLNLPTK